MSSVCTCFYFQVYVLSCCYRCGTVLQVSSYVGVIFVKRIQSLVINGSFCDISASLHASLIMRDYTVLAEYIYGFTMVSCLSLVIFKQKKAKYINFVQTVHCVVCWNFIKLFQYRIVSLAEYTITSLCSVLQKYVYSIV